VLTEFKYGSALPIENAPAITLKKTFNRRAAIISSGQIRGAARYAAGYSPGSVNDGLWVGGEETMSQTV